VSYPEFQMFVEYWCPDCKIRELDPCIIPKKECPKCQVMMEVIEEGECEAVG
jgi:phage FluMu protein Com